MVAISYQTNLSSLPSLFRLFLPAMQEAKNKKNIWIALPKRMPDWMKNTVKARESIEKIIEEERRPKLVVKLEGGGVARFKYTPYKIAYWDLATKEIPISK